MRLVTDTGKPTELRHSDVLRVLLRDGTVALFRNGSPLYFRDEGGQDDKLILGIVDGFHAHNLARLIGATFGFIATDVKNPPLGAACPEFIFE